MQYSVDDRRPHVDDRCSRLDIRAADETRDAGGNDDDVRHSRKRLEALGLFVQDGHGRMLREHQHGHRGSDHDGSPNHDGGAATQRPMRASFEQKHHRSGRCRHEVGAASEGEMALVDRMRAVHVLLQGNRIGDFPDGKMERKRLLKHDAVHRRIVAKGVQALANALRGCRFRKAVDGNVDAYSRSGFDQISYVGDARLVLADEDDHEFGMNTAVA